MTLSFPLTLSLIVPTKDQNAKGRYTVLFRSFFYDHTTLLEKLEPQSVTSMIDSLNNAIPWSLQNILKRINI